MLEINLKQLESFVATVEHSGFTAAAAALYLTQSTVSAHVSAQSARWSRHSACRCSCAARAGPSR